MMYIRKVVFIIFISFIFFSCSSIHRSQKSTVTFGEPSLSDCSTPIDLKDTATIAKRAIVDTFEILEIIKKEDAYVIMTAKDSILYQIISVKSKIKGVFKIKVGERYNLILNPYYKDDCMPGDHIYPIFVKGKTLHIGRRGGPNIYTTPNLEGLYYIGP